MLVRELFAKLGLDVDAQSFAKGELAASVVKASLHKLVEVIGETAHEFIEMVKETAAYGKETKEAAQSTGLTTDAIQRLRGAARATGVETGDLDTGLFRLSRTMYAAKKGGEEQIKTFATLGVKVKDSHGKLRGADDVMGDIADKFHKMPDGAEKTALAMEVFGRSGARLIPMLNKGKAALDELKASAVVMTDEQLEAGEQMTKTQRQLANMTTKLWRGAIAPLLPAINDLLKRYLAWRKATAEIMRQKIQDYLALAIKGVRALADLFSFLVRNAAMVKAVVITGLIIGFTQLAEASAAAAIKTALAWIAAAAPFVALAAIVAGLFLVFDDIRTYFADVEKGSKVQHSLFGMFKQQLDEWLKPNDNDPWFVKALKAFVQLLEDAIKLMQDFDVLTGKWKPGDANAGATASSPAWRKAQAPGHADFVRQQVDASRARAQDVGSDEPQGSKASFWMALAGGLPGLYNYATADDTAGGGQAPLRARAGGGAGSVRQLTVPMVVNAVPGMDAEQVGKIAADKIEEKWNNEMETAAAAVGP